MLVAISALLCLAQAQSTTQPSTQVNPSSTAKDSGASAELTAKLLSAKRIFVENFGADSISKTLQAMIVDALGSSKRFIVTENREKADLFLKGSALEKSTTEAHSLGSATTVASANGSSKGGISAGKLGIADSQSSVETVNDARASVRLVATDGDVVWSTTQESKGGKYKGATADVADKVVKQLMRDLAKFEAGQSVK